jgi:hypothetical protein
LAAAPPGGGRFFYVRLVPGIRRFIGFRLRFGNSHFQAGLTAATFDSLNTPNRFFTHLTSLFIMKKTFFALALSLAAFATQAQTTASAATTQTAPAGYTELMAASITELLSTADVPQTKAAVARFERAAAVAPADWLPAYYQSYGLLRQCFLSKEDGDTKDQYLDQAEAALARARKLGGDESELLVLQGYIYQARLGVSPMARSMKYSVMVNEVLSQAKQINPANPRIYLVRANNVYFTPKMFGGGAEVAKPIYDEAKVRYAAFRPSGPLAPNWGEKQLQARLTAYEQPASTTITR